MLREIICHERALHKRGRREKVDVLIVDDEIEYLQTLAKGFRNCAHEFNVITADGGKKALAVLKTVMVDVVVTDLNMPDMDGYELLRRLQQNHPLVRAIVLSAHARAYVENKLKGLQFAQYVEKPATLQEIASAVSCAV